MTSNQMRLRPGRWISWAYRDRSGTEQTGQSCAVTSVRRASSNNHNCANVHLVDNNYKFCTLSLPQTLSIQQTVSGAPDMAVPDLIVLKPGD